MLDLFQAPTQKTRILKIKSQLYIKLAVYSVVLPALLAIIIIS